jgi:hypothetical protein
LLILLKEEADRGLEQTQPFPGPILRRVHMTDRLPILSRLFRRTPTARLSERPAKFVPLLESLEGRALPSSLSPGLGHAARLVHHAVHVRHTTPVVLIEAAEQSRDKSPDASLDKSGTGNSPDKVLDKSGKTTADRSTDKSPDKSLDKSGETSKDKSVDSSTDSSADQSPGQSPDKPTDSSPNDSNP